MLGSAGKPFGPLDARATEVAAAFAQVKAPPALAPNALEVTFAPCPKLYDGRYANTPEYALVYKDYSTRPLADGPGARG